MKTLKFIFFAVAIHCLLQVCPAHAVSEHSTGLNKFDLVKQYLGTASGGDGSERWRKVTRAMGQKSIADARDAGVSYLRVAATGFLPTAFSQPGDLDLWIDHPSRYWGVLDDMMNDLEAAGVSAVVTFIWNPLQFPAMTGETVGEFLGNPRSRSYLLAERYIREFVLRYRQREAVFFYELTNELNLRADLDSTGRCRKEKSERRCEAEGNFSTDDMVGFTRRLAAFIRGLDPSRPISSGFSVPRPSAEHLRAFPEWRSGKADFTSDTPEQLEKNLKDIHEALDLISVHLYPNERNKRFGATDRRSTELLTIIKRAADRIGKPLFVGEFGDSEDLSGAETSYTVQMLNRIVELDVPFSAVWVWQFYQKTPYSLRDNKNTSYSLEFGATDGLIEKIRRANMKRGAAAPRQEGGDKTPPRVVLTWPLECSTIKGSLRLYAVASDDRGKVDRVEFWHADARLGVDTTSPYEWRVDSNEWTKGIHEVSARAYDAAGNMEAWATRIVVGDAAAETGCTVSFGTGR